MPVPSAINPYTTVPDFEEGTIIADTDFETRFSEEKTAHDNNDLILSAIRAMLGGSAAVTDDGSNTALPTTIGASGQVLQSNGTVAAWATPTQSFDAVSITGGTITGLDSPLPIASGGTAATTASAARTALGVAIGTDVQAHAAKLDDIAALAVTDSNFIVGNGSTFVVEAPSTARTSLGLGALATKATVNNADWSGTDLALANGGTGASDAPGARTNLGLGAAALLGVPIAVADGGTGATTPVNARANLGILRHKTLAFAVQGDLVVGASTLDFDLDGVSGTIARVVGRLVTAPTGSSAIVDITVNGTSIWNDGGNRLTFPAGTKRVAQSTINNAAVADGDLVQVDIDQIGSSVAGAWLLGRIEIEEAA